MDQTPDRCRENRLRLASRIAALGVLIASLTLLAWGSRWLPFPGVAPMSQPAACGLATGAIAVCLLSCDPPWSPWWITIPGGWLAASGIWIFVADFTRGGIGPSSFFDHAAVVLETGGGRPVPQTAFTFLLLGLGLALSPWPRTARAALWGWVPASVVIPYLLLVGYLFQVSRFGGLGANDMTLASALCLFVLATAALAARPSASPLRELTRESTGGIMIRRLAFPLLAAPPLFTWLDLLALRNHLWGASESAAILTIGLTALGLGSTAWNVSTLDRNDQALQARVELDRLKDLERYRTRLLSLLWHELRTPLSFITGFTSLLEDEIAGALTPTQHQYLSQIETGAGRLLKLVSNILDLSETALGELKLDRGPVRLGDLARNVIDSLAPEARTRGLHVDADIQDTGTEKLDADRIQRALYELVENAIKFTAAGGRIEIRVSDRGDQTVQVDIVDTGPGMTSEQLAMALQRFQQVDMSSTRAAGGLGIGLSFAKTIVEAHGGTFEIRSDPDQGTHCVLALPR